MTRKRRRRANKTGRDEGEPHFIQIPYWVLEAEAARELSPVAFKLLVYLLMRHNGTNNGKIPFGVRSGCCKWDKEKHKLVNLNIGISRTTTADALHELQFFGLVACEKESVFERSTDFKEGQKQVREWRITWLPTKCEPSTKDFARLTAQQISAFNSERKSKNCVRSGRLSDKLQSSRTDKRLRRNAGNGTYSPRERTDAADASPHDRTHIDTIPGGRA